MSLTTKEAAAIAGILGIIGGMGGSTIESQINPPRPYPFTSQDADQLEERFEERLHLEIAKAEAKIYHKIRLVEEAKPPEATRMRILYLESRHRRTDDNFNPPTTQWGP